MCVELWVVDWIEFIPLEKSHAWISAHSDKKKRKKKREKKQLFFPIYKMAI